jgi:mono/diheme cytochrome c family protein
MFSRFCKGVTEMKRLLVPAIAFLVIGALADDGPVDVEAGQAVYSQTCIACHGANGKGTIPGVRDFTAADGPLAKSDEELVKSITEGFQSPGSPLSMPPKGGNPALTEEDVQAVLAYLRATFGT